MARAEDKPTPRETVDVAAMVEYEGRDLGVLTPSEREVLRCFIATTQLYVDWFGDSRTLFTPWFGEEIFGIPRTTVRRAMKSLATKGYIEFAGLKRTYRSARKQGSLTVLWDLMVKTHYGDFQFRTPDGSLATCNMTQRMTLTAALSRMYKLGEVKRVWRMKNQQYFVRFGPIDAYSRKSYLLQRLSVLEEWDYGSSLRDICEASLKSKPDLSSRKVRRPPDIPPRADLAMFDKHSAEFIEASKIISVQIARRTKRTYQHDRNALASRLGVSQAYASRLMRVLWGRVPPSIPTASA